VNIARIDLADLFLRLADQIGAAGHLAPNYQMSIGFPLLQKV
jgi:hypothetical protein